MVAKAAIQPGRRATQGESAGKPNRSALASAAVFPVMQQATSASGSGAVWSWPRSVARSPAARGANRADIAEYFLKQTPVAAQSRHGLAILSVAQAWASKKPIAANRGLHRTIPCCRTGQRRSAAPACVLPMPCCRCRAGPNRPADCRRYNPDACVPAYSPPPAAIGQLRLRPWQIARC